MRAARPDRPAQADGAWSARDVLANRSILVDTVVPPLVFVGVDAIAGLGAAAAASLGLCAVVLVVRLVRRERLVYAVSGLGGVAVGVGFALAAGDASGFFVPGIVANAVFAVLCAASVLVRRPALAYTSAAIYRWPLDWYWHPRVRPAYSEMTWVWAAYYAAKAGVQWALVEREALGALAAVRIATGWPALAVLLVATYAYIRWRLERLGGPSVDELRNEREAPTDAAQG